MNKKHWTDQLSIKAQPQQLLEILKERNQWWKYKNAQRWTIDHSELPLIDPDQIDFSCDQEFVTIQSRRPLTQKEQNSLKKQAQQLIPWKKGPFKLFELTIDAEWKSDLKWNRLEKHLLTLQNKNVLDIGCNNGYFLYRCASRQCSPKMVLGIDPVLPCHAQFHLLQHFAQIPHIFMELLGVEHLPLMKESFDTCFFMGIIYHHRNPIQQLIDIREALRPGGQVIIESIGIPGKEEYALCPSESYAGMKNVWFIPTINALINWIHRSRFVEIQILSDILLTEKEQRSTPWCPAPHRSLKQGLSPYNSKRTKEGHPAPRRFMLSARKKW